MIPLDLDCGFPCVIFLDMSDVMKDGAQEATLGPLGLNVQLGTPLVLVTRVELARTLCRHAIEKMRVKVSERSSKSLQEIEFSREIVEGLKDLCRSRRVFRNDDGPRQ
jgi:hypothetical protein